jgi:hypothetical protein
MNNDALTVKLISNGLFDDTFDNSNYVVPIDRMFNEMKGTSCGLISGNILAFTERNEKNHYRAPLGISS